MTGDEAPGAARPKTAFGRLLADFRIEGATTPNGLLPAEEKLVAAAARGEWCFVSDLDWAKEDDFEKLREDEQYRVRSAVLRCLAFGGDASAPVHEKGIQIVGAFVCGSLDFEDAKLERPLWLQGSYFDEGVTLRNARMRTVSLCGSRVAGIQGDGARIEGDMFLSNGFKSEGDVRLLGAEIVGDLDCSKSTFRKKIPSKVALHCDGANIAGGVFLNDEFSADGEVRLLHVEIGGNLVCNKATFHNEGGKALQCQGVTVKDVLFFRDGFKATGEIDLTAANVQSLVDEDVVNHKDGASALLLDGFTYERFAGQTLTDAKRRAAWLKRQRAEHLGADFRPQPFEQLAKVLRTMGHDKDAREIGFLKEKLFRPQRVRRADWLAKPFVWLQWWLYGLVAGYGYKPHRIIWILVFLWLGGAVIYWQAAERGLMVPADAQVWTQPDLQSCRPPKGNWTRCPQAKELPEFQPLVYSADVLVPIIDIGQGRYWAPIEALLRWVVVLEKVLGTLLVLLFGAIVSGLVRRI